MQIQLSYSKHETSENNLLKIIWMSFILLKWTKHKK
jgi:hypothetical protein